MKKIIFIICMLVTANSFSEDNFKQTTKEERIKNIEKIFCKAEKDWPNDFSMQKWQIEKEFNALTKLQEYKNDLEKLLNEQLVSFAYPFGFFNDESKKIVKELGYDYGVATDSGPFYINDDLYEIRRIGIFPDVTMNKFKRRIHNQRYIRINMS